MIDKRIVKFLKKHHVMTIATCTATEPWCASCFYIYMEDENALVFTTDTKTRHGQEFVKNPAVSGAIALETMIIGKIRGVQFSGVVSEPSGEMEDKARSAYIKRFPVAMLMETRVWIAELRYIKYTDNRLGFGKKLVWEKQDVLKQ
jgi:hypothetical protein